MSTTNLSIQDEYKTLREELLQAKKYIFERPLVIVALGITSIKLIPESYLTFLPLALSGVLLFNFWFTANRIMSAARIVAYIQLELEQQLVGRWVGWETCLRFYRKWLKLDPDKKVKSIPLGMDECKDAMMFYEPIYTLHIALMISALVSAFFVTIYNLNLINILCTLGVVLVSWKFKKSTTEYSPNWAMGLIERNRIIWYYVFKYMVQENAK